MDEMKFNESLEKKVGEPTLAEEIDEQILRDETPSQTILKKMFRKDGIKDKSDLYDEEIGELTQLLTIGKRLELDIVEDFVNAFLILRVSKDRLGRTEGFNVTKAEAEAKLRGQSPLVNFFGGKMPNL